VDRKAEAKKSLALDVAALRAKLGPVKVGLIDQWIREVNGPLDQALATVIRPGALVLDLGCSRGDPDLPSLGRGRYHLGVDIDLPGLRGNGIADGVACAPMHALPLADASVDVIGCKWVVEHLEDPVRDFAECRRVLVPGGAMVLLTPNAWSFFTLISMAIPYRLKQILKGNMFGLHEEDTFRTWYRANTRRQLDAAMRAAGLEPGPFLRLPGMWTFFIFSPPLARLVRRLELLQARVGLLRPFLTYVVATYRRPE
jgi:SAM-dependent methyltransferase